MINNQIRARGVATPRVLATIRRVPRHEFVPEPLRDQAYADRPLSIGHEQTISQPYIVAYMTDLLDSKGHHKVLEVGMGSGYQAALLAELASEVYTVETIVALAQDARKRLTELGYNIIHVLIGIGDGTRGWPQHQPYDIVMVTAGAPRVPQPLIDQLAEGGRMVIPVGNHESQELIVLERLEGRIVKSCLGGCRFVPLLGEWGWQG